MIRDNSDDGRVADANRDPLTGAPGAHPVGVGAGALAGGAAAGAAVGTIAGPVGTAIGAAVGAVAGGLVGKGIAEGIDPTAEDAYWRENYASRDYVSADRTYDDYGPAYGYGVSQYQSDRRLEDVESELADGWMGARGSSTLSWGDASPAARDAWSRLDSHRKSL